MKKEEILARSRQEKADEGIEYAMNRGRSAGVRAPVSYTHLTLPTRDQV